MNFNDTIAAIATPIGEGGIGIIRISGNQAKVLGLTLLRNTHKQTFTDFKSRHVYYGLVIHPKTGQTIDEVLFFFTPEPHSYTAENVLEIQAHGGMLTLKKIMEILLQAGARMAEPGEFTLRAFINGRIDLVQAESVIDLIRAKTDRAHELALTQLTGDSSREIHRIESSLYRVLISVEAVLDFPEEGLPDVEQEKCLQQIRECKEQLKTISENLDEGRKIRDGVQLVIVGRPNVGKSSLLNAFIQEDKAIVTEIPGTTRDIIETQFQLEGIPFILVDTAGVRETQNPIEKIGINKAEQHIKNADLVLLVLDGSQPLSDEDHLVISKVSGRPLLVIVNKRDLPLKLDLKEAKELENDTVLEVSSLTRQGFDKLEKTIIELVGLGNIQMDDRPLLSRIRHKNALQNAITGLQSAQSALTTGISEDLLAVDLRSALTALGEITGKNVTEEVVHGIFSTFCIGK